MTTPSRVAVLSVALVFAIGYCQEAPKAVSSHEALTAVATKVAAEYPVAAKQFHLEGSVELAAVVGESGSVEAVEVISGNPILAGAAKEALKRWKFKPFTEEGKAIRVKAPITFAFKL